MLSAIQLLPTFLLFFYIKNKYIYFFAWTLIYISIYITGTSITNILTIARPSVTYIISILTVIKSQFIYTTNIFIIFIYIIFTSSTSILTIASINLTCLGFIINTNTIFIISICSASILIFTIFLRKKLIHAFYFLKVILNYHFLYILSFWLIIF